VKILSRDKHSGLFVRSVIVRKDSE